MARIIQRDKDGRPVFVAPPPPTTRPEDEKRKMDFETGKDEIEANWLTLAGKVITFIVH